MERPSEPSVEPSEPERERQIAEFGLGLLKDPDTPKIISLESVRDYLDAAGLDVDSEGFIVDAESGERVEPYAFDDEAFRASHGASDNPFDAYYRPESEVGGVLIGAKQSVHLSDLHTVQFFDGEPHPIRDDSMNLQEALARTGVTFPTVMEWSDAVNLIRDADAQVVEIHLESEKPLSLNCLDCEYTGELETWDEDEEGDLRCPECNCLWECFNLEVCTSCQTQHRWEDITPEDGGGMYWEPSCPDCNAGGNFLHSEDRYSDIESDETERVVEEWEDEDDEWDDPREDSQSTPDTENSVEDRHLDAAREFEEKHWS